MIEGVQEPVPEVHTGPFVSATAPAIGRAESEDVTGMFEDHTAWVLDGADDPLADATKCEHDAVWYVRALHQALTKSLPENQPVLNVLLHNAIQHVRDAHEAACEYPLSRKPSATVGILHCSSDSIDYLVLGDASILLESHDAVIHVTDRRMHRFGQEIRSEILDRLRHGHGYDDPQRPALLRRLVQEEQFARNTDSGYPIATYDPEAAFDSVTASLSFSHSTLRIDRAALLSDGAERAMSTFSLCPNSRAFMKAVTVEGPAECIKRIREAELLDHSGREYPRTKLSDDASIILWSGTSSDETWL